MYTRILVPVDGSPTGERGVREAISIAAALKSRLVLLHVVDDMPMMVETAALDHEHTHTALLKAGKTLLARVAKAASEAGVESEGVLRDVNAVPVADVIVEEARAHQCSLVVMGTHGRRGLKRLTMGSDAELVVRQATVPVLLVRQQEEKA